MKHGELRDHPGVRTQASVNPATGSYDLESFSPRSRSQMGRASFGGVDPRDIDGVVKRLNGVKKGETQPPL